MTKKARQYIVRIVLVFCIIFLFLAFQLISNYLSESAFNSKEELVTNIEQMFRNRNQAIINKDLNLIKSLYDVNTKYGSWAYEYEQRKVKYIQNWGYKQGVNFIEIVPKILIKSEKKYENSYKVVLQSSTEYKYVYKTKPSEVNTSKIGSYHILELVNKDGRWVIRKEWYKDPFGDYLNLNNLKVDKITEYILSQNTRDFSTLNERRLMAVEYAEKYNGASNDKQYEFKYNKKYRNYNPQGGDCANFASQVLFEGGKFRKTSGWNYDGSGATRSWVNAGGFTQYMLYSNRASLIAYGTYDKVLMSSYKLLPGDFIAYEDKGNITHVSIVTGADSKGYSLVSCHNTDRNRVPWDLGWSKRGIKFWLIRVHY